MGWDCSLQSRKFWKEYSCVELRSPGMCFSIAVGCSKSLAFSVTSITCCPGCCSCPAVTMIPITVVATIQNLLRIGLVFLASTCHFPSQTLTKGDVGGGGWQTLNAGHRGEAEMPGKGSQGRVLSPPQHCKKVFLPSLKKK